MKLSELKINPKNPRIIKDERFMKLVKSVQEFPKMLKLRPIVIDNAGIVLGGNMRLKALQHLKYKEIPDEWVKRADELTDEERERFIIEDNVPFGEWDWDLLQADWDIDVLKEWGLEIPSFDKKEQNDLSNELNTFYKIEIECEDELQQQIIYDKLISENYKCRLLTF